MISSTNVRSVSSKCRALAPRLALAVATTLGVTMAPAANAVPFFSYKFTPIADTKSGLWEFVGFSPSINNSARVAWQGRLAGSPGVEGIFARTNTGGITTLQDTGVDPYVLFGMDPIINNANQVLFFGFHDNTDQQLLLGTSFGVPVVKTSAGLFTSLSGFGFQLNDAGTAAFGAKRHDGIDVVFTRNAAGTQKLITGTGGFFNVVDHRPSINNVGTVFFTGTTSDNIRGIFKLEPGGSINAVTNSNTELNTFSTTDANDAGQVAWTGSKDDGTRGVFRIGNGGTLSLITVADSVGTLSSFGGVSINAGGRVAFDTTLDNGSKQIRIGPNSVSPRMVGTGDVIFGRTVNNLFIDRGALNDSSQLVAKLTFSDGSQMIARIDPQAPIFDQFVLTAALQLTTLIASDKPAPTGGVTVTKAIKSAMPSITLTFDVRFLAPGANLAVNVNGKAAQLVKAANFGARTSVKVPIDAKTFGNQDGTYELQFAYEGASGATAQIDRVVISDDRGATPEKDGLPDWKVVEKGGSAEALDTTRFPVKIIAGTRGIVSAGKPIPVTILSNEGLDAPGEIDVATVRIAGAAGRTKPVTPTCKKTDADGDGIADLYCEVTGPDLTAVRGSITLQVEAETTSAMPILGEQSVMVR
jgi:hypothetical protein